MTKGMVRVRASALSRLSTSMPSTLGSFKSSSTSLGGRSRERSACAPFAKKKVESLFAPYGKSGEHQEDNPNQGSADGYNPGRTSCLPSLLHTQVEQSRFLALHFCNRYPYRIHPRFPSRNTVGVGTFPVRRLWSTVSVACFTRASISDANKSSRFC